MAGSAEIEPGLVRLSPVGRPKNSKTTPKAPAMHVWPWYVHGLDGPRTVCTAYRDTL